LRCVGSIEARRYVEDLYHSLLRHRVEEAEHWPPDVTANGQNRVAAPCGLIAVAASADLIGQASIIDGDAIELYGTRIRLWGIDALESSQRSRGS